MLRKYKEYLLGKLVNELDIKRDVNFLFVALDKEDDDFYFDWHLGLSKEYVARIVKKGYDAADKMLKRYDFL